MKQFLFTLCLAVSLVVLLAVAYWLHLPGVSTFLGSLNDTFSQIFGALFVGIKILFFVFLTLGIAYAVIELRKRSRLTVIAPGKHGPAQAVVHRGELVHLQSPTGQAQMDPLQQLAFLQKALQMQNQFAKLVHTSVQEIGPAGPHALSGPVDKLPTDVNYEDIRNQIPKGHILVGIGRKGIETKERAVGACTWIVGLSGTGKTSTTVLRVDERATDGHRFLGVDPHWYKPDSLTNAITGYASRFLLPMACTPEESKKVLTAFLAEFNGRKGGRIPKPWQKITLLVDEVGSLMDPTTDEEEEVAKMLPSIARICGQEARNFEMGGIFISQQATGLAWLRKVALMVIVHQLLQESEKKLATNNDTAAMLDMKTWPIGRTYVFGVGFGTEGPRTVQQPHFDSPDEVESTIEDLPQDFHTQQPEVNEEATGSHYNEENAISDLSTIKTLREIGKRLKAGEEKAKIVKSFGLPYGRATQEMGAVVDMVAQEIEAEA